MGEGNNLSQIELPGDEIGATNRDVSPPEHMSWTTHEYYFKATNDQVTLQFTKPESEDWTYWGGLIDLVSVQQVTATMKSKRYGEDEWDQDTTSIAVGAIDSNIHKAEVAISFEPYTKLTIELDAPVAYSSGNDAVLTIDGIEEPLKGPTDSVAVITDANGTITAILRSSDRANTETTIRTKLGDAVIGELSIKQDWDNYDANDQWTSEFDSFRPGKSSTEQVKFALDDAPLDDHEIGFYLERVVYVDRRTQQIVRLTNTPDDPSDLSDFGEFDPKKSRTDAKGVATSEFKMKRTPSKFVLELELVAYDFNARTEGRSTSTANGMMTLMARAKADDDRKTALSKNASSPKLTMRLPIDMAQKTMRRYHYVTADGEKLVIPFEFKRWSGKPSEIIVKMPDIAGVAPDWEKANSDGNGIVKSSSGKNSADYGKLYPVLNSQFGKKSFSLSTQPSRLNSKENYIKLFFDGRKRTPHEVVVTYADPNTGEQHEEALENEIKNWFFYYRQFVPKMGDVFYRDKYHKDQDASGLYDRDTGKVWVYDRSVGHKPGAIKAIWYNRRKRDEHPSHNIGGPNRTTGLDTLIKILAHEKEHKRVHTAYLNAREKYEKELENWVPGTEKPEDFDIDQDGVDNETEQEYDLDWDGREKDSWTLGRYHRSYKTKGDREYFGRKAEEGARNHKLHKQDWASLLPRRVKPPGGKRKEWVTGKQWPNDGGFEKDKGVDWEEID